MSIKAEMSRKSKTSKGILGLRKSVHGQLMPFGPYSEAFPSDDSEDSDYNPSDVGLRLRAGQAQAAPGENTHTATTLKHRTQRKTKVAQKRLKKTVNSGNTRAVRRYDNYKEQSTTSQMMQNNQDLTDKKRKSDAPSSEGNTPQKKGKSYPLQTCDKSKNSTGLQSWSNIIPDELLLRIFTYVVESDGRAVPVLCRISRVCWRWNRLASEPCLWRKLDMSNLGCLTRANDNTVSTHLKKHLPAVEELNMEGWRKLSNRGVKVIAQNSSRLRTLCLSNCEGITNQAMIILKQCKGLTSIDFSRTKGDHKTSKALIDDLGHQLVEIYLANCKHVGPTLLAVIQEKCHNLRLLDLSGTYVRYFNVEKLQTGCPKLKELRLANLWLSPVSSRVKKGAQQGFDHLEFLTLATAKGSLDTNDSFIQRMLKTSTKLNLLDIRGCYSVTAAGLRSIPATSLKYLYLSKAEAAMTMIRVIAERWIRTLVVLELAFNTNIGDDALTLLAGHKPPCLKSLDLSGTTVTSKGVREILKSCPSLTEINLSCCRGVPRGTKQQHTGPQALNQLLGCLEGETTITIGDSD